MINKYGFRGGIKLAVSLLFSKLFYPETRLLRLPIDIRNKRYINFGRNLTTGVGCRLEAYPQTQKKALRFGHNIQMNDYVHITAMDHVEICDNVLIASKVYISDCTHGSYLGDENDSSPLSCPSERPLSQKPVVIKENVWIGESVSILPGVSVGKGTIIGANSVVTKDLPDYVIAVGVPAKPVKKFNFNTKKWEKI